MWDLRFRFEGFRAESRGLGGEDSVWGLRILILKIDTGGF